MISPPHEVISAMKGASFMTSEDKNKIVEEIIQEMKKEGIPVLINHGSVRSVPTFITVSVSLGEETRG